MTEGEGVVVGLKREVPACRCSPKGVDGKGIGGGATRPLESLYAGNQQQVAEASLERFRFSAAVSDSERDGSCVRVDNRSIIPVAVLDPTPCFRRGLSTELRSAGYSPAYPGDPVVWAQTNAPCGVALTVETDRDWNLIHDLPTANGACMAVILMDGAGVSAHRRGLQAGASAVVDRGDCPGGLLLALMAASRGCRLVPDHLAREWAATAAEPLPSWVTLEDRRLLEFLEEDATLAEIGIELHLSERTVSRRLQDLLARMQVEHRAAAVSLAARWGLLGRPGPVRRSQRDPGDDGG